MYPCMYVHVYINYDVQTERNAGGSFCSANARPAFGVGYL